MSTSADEKRSTNHRNRVFIAISLDGYIADDKGKVDFLYLFPDPVDDDMGYAAFMEGVDALLMGRKTFETVIGFGVEWPYKVPVYVWTSDIADVPPELEGKVMLVSGTVEQVVDYIHDRGHLSLYIDGGQVIQSLLEKDLIEEMIITIAPVLLGAGRKLFGDLSRQLSFRCVSSKVYPNGLVQSRFVRSGK